MIILMKQQNVLVMIDTEAQTVHDCWPPAYRNVADDYEAIQVTMAMVEDPGRQAAEVVIGEMGYAIKETPAELRLPACMTALHKLVLRVNGLEEPDGN